MPFTPAPRWPLRHLALAAGLVLAASADAGAQGARLPPSLEVRTPKPPTVLAASGGQSLVYELHVTNFGNQPITLRRLEIVSDGDQRILLALEDSALARTLTRPGVNPPPAAAARATIAGGLRAVAFLWVPIEGTLPSRLHHRLTIARGAGDSVTTESLDRTTVAVSTNSAVIGAPLRGGPWLAANGPDALSGHRRALIAAGDVPTIAQRFAIDYVKLDSSYKTHSGDAARNENYYAENQEALAVADGIVAVTKDSIPENVPGINSRAVPITLETVGGNHVIVDIGGGHYAFYAHLRPGSLRVKRGDKVKRGQVLGLVGNSGNSTEPHLHFHISDSPSPLGSEGVPYRHDRFELLGECTQMFAGCKLGAPSVRTREMPLSNKVVQFPR